MSARIHTLLDLNTVHLERFEVFDQGLRDLRLIGFDLQTGSWLKLLR